MLNTAYIEATRHTSPLGKIEQETYKWVGKSPYVRVSRFLARDLGGDGKQVQIGPYKLLRIDDGVFYGDFDLYVRSDKFGALRVALYKATRMLDLFYRRLIITLVVWELAEFSYGAIPTWKDIKILKRFAR